MCVRVCAIACREVQLGWRGPNVCQSRQSVDLIGQACAAHEGRIVLSLNQCGEA